MKDRRIEGLDGMRAISLLLVISAHWGVSETFDRFNNWGRFGLVIFFVISGFLITRILLALREEIDEGVKGGGDAIRSFYLRRSVRIFPVYYLAVFYTAYSGLNDWVREDLWWHLTFLANFPAAFVRPQGGYDPIFPLWSLCVEEQFYLLWAPAILFMSRKAFVWLVTAMLVGGYVYRAAMASLGFSGWEIVISTPANVDSLAAGALVAMLIYRSSAATAAMRYIALAVFALATGWIVYIGWLKWHGLRWHFWVNDIAYYSFAASVIWSLATGTAPRMLVSFLESRPMAYLGVRSYGFYVFHQIVPYTGLHVFAYFMTPMERLGWPGIFYWFPATLLLSIISYRYLERPLLRRREMLEKALKEFKLSPARDSR